MDATEMKEENSAMAGDSHADANAYELEWQFVPRLAVEHLGSQKYSSSTKALRELIANSLDARATAVDIALNENTMGGLESVAVSDNGRGISPRDLRTRFVTAQ